MSINWAMMTVMMTYNAMIGWSRRAINIGGIAPIIGPMKGTMLKNPARRPRISHPFNPATKKPRQQMTPTTVDSITFAVKKSCNWLLISLEALVKPALSFFGTLS